MEDTVGTLGFAQRAKKIKNEVRQNVEMGVKEYKYLCDALKEEVCILRGDLKKSNLPIHLVIDKKLLAFLPQDAIHGEGGEEGTITPMEHKNSSGSMGNIKIRKRQSLLNLYEEQMIIKYCELKAKYDNLLFSSSAKIYELTSAKDLVVSEDNTGKTSSKEDQELIKKYEMVMEEKEKVIYDLRNKIKEQESEIEGNNQMMECNMTDIKQLEERIEKHSNIKN